MRFGCPFLPSKINAFLRRFQKHREARSIEIFFFDVLVKDAVHEVNNSSVLF